MADVRPVVALLAATTLLAVPAPATASPNFSVALTAGGGVEGVRSPGARDPIFHLGGRGAALFLRERDAQMALGPYVEVATSSFSSIELGAGGEWLVPVWAHLPLVFSAGPFVRKAGPTWEPGLTTTAFLGPRSHNFHSSYGIAGGGFLQSRFGFGDSRQWDLILGVHVDLAVLALPFLLLTNAAR